MPVSTAYERAHQGEPICPFAQNVVSYCRKDCVFHDATYSCTLNRAARMLAKWAEMKTV